ncbi:MAG: hypothetical protein LBL96_08760 [Clostridiales bacterium]|nr:hypothetical protein [Clostridiales bacterium]
MSDFIAMDSVVIQWLLDNSNPAVKYRTQTELLDIPKKRSNQAILLTEHSTEAGNLGILIHNYALPFFTFRCRALGLTFMQGVPKCGCLIVPSAFA